MSDTETTTLKFENERLILKEKYLILKGSDISTRLSKNQRILVRCLMNGIIEKEKIIQEIWHGHDVNTKEKNYNQLVFQTRSLLNRQGFPRDLIMTIHRYGLCFNKYFLLSADVPEHQEGSHLPVTP